MEDREAVRIRRPRLAALAWLAAAGFGGAAAIGSAAASTTPGDPAAGIAGVTRAASAASIGPAALFDASPVGDCNACHVPEPIFSHPLGVVPSAAAPPLLPLDGGRMTCLTCHRDATGLEHAAATTASPLLRMDAALLCVQCHDPAGTERGDMHASALGLAHLPEPGAGSARSRRHAPATLRPEGDACLTCHDGTVAGGIDHGRRDARRARPDTIDGSHPIGIVYPRAQTLWDGPPLHPRAGLDRRVRLFDDRIECGSCHSPYSPEPGLLVMSNFASALCLSCHDE